MRTSRIGSTFTWSFGPVHPLPATHYDFDRDAVRFSLLSDGRAIDCLITKEALWPQLVRHRAGNGANPGDDLLEAFALNREVIERTVLDLWRQRGCPDGLLCVTSRDIRLTWRW